MSALQELRILTWHGRYEAVVDALWKLAHRPTPEAERCIMGYTIGGIARCPRPSHPSRFDLFCKRHDYRQEVEK